VEDSISLEKESVVVYDAVIKQDVLVHVFPCMGVFDFPMAAKYSSFIGASATEHCTSCNIVQPKTRTERRDWAKSSVDAFDVRDVRFAGTQERTSAIISRVKGFSNISTAAMKCALLLNGVTVGVGDVFLRLTEGRGPGSFDVHEHVIAAPSPLIYYGMASQLLEEAYDALSIEQRDLLVRPGRAFAAHVSTNTVLTTFEPEKTGGTTLSMSDYAVLLTVTPAVLESILMGSNTLPHQAALLRTLLSLRGCASTLFYRPSIASDGEHAVKTKPTVKDLQRLARRAGDAGHYIPISVWENLGEGNLSSFPRAYIYLFLPLIQLGPSMCELIFEKFHPVSKHAVLRSNGHNSADHSMNYWRDAELISRAVSQPEKRGLCRSWFLNQKGSLMKAVSQHLLAAGVFAVAEQEMVGRAGRQVHG